MKNGNYTLIKPPEDYPAKRYRGKYAYEHHIVWWKNTGTTIPTGYNIHHKNEDSRDNRFENLEIISIETHARIHKSKSTNKWEALICECCKNPFTRLKRRVNSQRNAGQTMFYCSRSHQVSSQQKRRHQGEKYTQLKCAYCDKLFQRLSRFVKAKIKKGQTNFFCSRSHHVSHQHTSQVA